MGRLLLVRHAQASFLSKNYDQLSAQGEAQARLLGEYWGWRAVLFDRVCTGPAERHRRTAEIAGEACRKAGLTFAEPVVMQEFDEFQGDAVLARSLPQLLETNAKIRQLHEAMGRSRSETEKRANFQRLFEAVISMWVGGGIAPTDVESWQEFRVRINRGLSSLLATCSSGQIVVIFTSGGPVGRGGTAGVAFVGCRYATCRLDVPKLLV